MLEIIRKRPPYQIKVDLYSFRRGFEGTARGTWSYEDESLLVESSTDVRVGWRLEVTDKTYEVVLVEISRSDASLTFLFLKERVGEKSCLPTV